VAALPDPDPQRRLQNGQDKVSQCHDKISQRHDEVSQCLIASGSHDSASVMVAVTLRRRSRVHRQVRTLPNTDLESCKFLCLKAKSDPNSLFKHLNIRENKRSCADNEWCRGSPGQPTSSRPDQETVGFLDRTEIISIPFYPMFGSVQCNHPGGDHVHAGVLPRRTDNHPDLNSRHVQGLHPEQVGHTG
jgi:hypothetical protein